MLLATARAHAEARDLPRALAVYDRLLASDASLLTLTPLQEEIEEVRRHQAAVEQAVELAEGGHHDAAWAAFDGICDRPGEHLLPFRVESRPTGARVESSNGQVRTAPFVAKSSIGEVVELRLSMPGFEERVVRLNRPADQLVMMFKLPERAWPTPNQIEAVPVAVGEDHILCDRGGHVRRMDAEGRSVWERELETLGGIARTPIFLPGRPGTMLILSEDGQAWLLDSATGRTEGPLDVGSPPLQGPRLTRSGATVAFADGRVGIWGAALQPQLYTDETLFPTTSLDDSGLSTLAVLRRSADAARTLESPWNDWRVEIRDDDFLVLDSENRGFSVERDGDWAYVAWESPRVFVPNGRLWVSDGKGLRAYLPSSDELVAVEEGDPR